MAKEEKRLDILGGAAKVFSKHGLHKAKIEDIAKEAGVGKGTIYEYFDSKKELFQEMIKYSFDKYKQEVADNFISDEPIRDKLISFCIFHGRFISEHLDMAQAALSQAEILSQDMKCWMIEGRAELGKIIALALEKAKVNGELRKDLDLEIAIYAIFGTINQYYSKRIFFDNDSCDDIDPTPVIDILLKGFY